MNRWQLIKSNCIYQETGEEFEFYHVVPTFGNEHILTPDCWCKPKFDPESPNTIIHNHDFKVVK